MNINPINNVIIFKFLDPVNAKGEFEKAATESGIILKGSADDSAKSPRWATVTHVGPGATVEAGQQILIPNLRWTNGFKIDGVYHWKTDQTEIAAVRTSPTSKVTAVNDYVLFVKNKPSASFTSHSGLLVMTAATTDTPSGRVLSVGPDASDDLIDGVIYYSDVNFTNDFVHGSVNLAFVKEEEVLVYVPAGA